jgi:hypothetical protein
MATVKKVVGSNGLYAPYDIYSNVVTIHGNLNVIGNTSYINSNTFNIANAYFILNDTEVGAGVTNGNSGIVIDRGSLANAYWVWDEVTTTFRGTIAGNLVNISAANPVNPSDVVTKGYLANVGGTAGGNVSEVQFNIANILTGSQFFTFANGNVKVYNTVIGNGNVTTSGTNQDLVLSANGSTGYVTIDDVLKISFQSTPTNVASTTFLYANTVGVGNSGLFFVNNSTNDELLAKNRAVALSIIFG